MSQLLYGVDLVEIDLMAAPELAEAYSDGEIYNVAWDPRTESFGYTGDLSDGKLVRIIGPAIPTLPPPTISAYRFGLA